MNGLIASAKKIEEYGALLDCVKNTRLSIGMTGLSHIHKAHFAAALNADCGSPVLGGRGAGFAPCARHENARLPRPALSREGFCVPLDGEPVARI